MHNMFNRPIMYKHIILPRLLVSRPRGKDISPKPVPCRLIEKRDVTSLLLSEKEEMLKVGDPSFVLVVGTPSLTSSSVWYCGAFMEGLLEDDMCLSGKIFSYKIAFLETKIF